MRRSNVTISIGILVLLIASVPVRAASPRQLRWQELSIVTGKNVSVVMPGGTLISGKVLSVDAAAMTMNITRTSDPGSYPKGDVRVPRANLRTLVVHTKGRKFRVLGTVLGAVAGLTGGLGAKIGIQGGPLGDERPVAAGVALAGIAVGVTAAGYLVGNQADRRSTTYKILP
jgi:hypothetical protein